MTVAACILAASPDTALRDVDGTPNVRRLVDLAWAGGAFPVVVIVADLEGAIATALAGATVILGAPAPVELGPAGQMARAIDLARAEVDATDAALMWPARMGWLDAETVTSLIEAHGTDRATLLRPAYRGTPGWPILVPAGMLATLRALAPDQMPSAIAAALAAASPSRIVELGDPGVCSASTRPVTSCRPLTARPGQRRATATNGAPWSPRARTRRPSCRRLATDPRVSQARAPVARARHRPR